MGLVTGGRGPGQLSASSGPLVAPAAFRASSHDPEVTVLVYFSRPTTYIFHQRLRVIRGPGKTQKPKRKVSEAPP